MKNQLWDQRLARVFVGPLAAMGVSPNLITSIGLGTGVASGCLYALGDPGMANWAAFLFVYSVFNDHLDGELARRTGKASRFGHYFDHVAAATSYLSMFVGAGIGYRDGALGDWSILLGVAAGFSVVMIFTVRIWVEDTAGKQRVRQSNIAGFEVEDILYLVGPVTWLGGMLPFVAAAGIGTPIFLAWAAWRARRARLVRSSQGS